MWLVDPALLGWSDRSGAAALTAGLRHRPREALLRDRLTWERPPRDSRHDELTPLTRQPNGHVRPSGPVAMSGSTRNWSCPTTEPVVPFSEGT